MMRAQHQSPKGHGKSILVVEDDAEIRDTLDGLLRIEGYDVVTCANGLEALERLRGGTRADLILLDLMMPVMDGWQFRVHQKRDPELASLPVIAISADATPKAAAIDADAYLRKPVDYDLLIGTIERTILMVERKQLQAKIAETDRLASLGTLAAGVAHEINNPLAYVMANLAFIAEELPSILARAQPAPSSAAAAQRDGRDGDDDDDGQIVSALDEARSGCDRIRAIVRDLQLFSRGSMDDKVPVDVRKVLDSSINIVAGEIRHRARLTKRYEEVPRVAGSEARLGQVFLNLLVNAVQAIPEGRPAENEIAVVARNDGDRVLVEVRDSGEGIRPEVRARIFDPFFTTKPVGVGTGLGLSIVHSLVTSMHGHISVESEPGRGATFRVWLPKLADDAPARSPSRRPSARAQRGRVLVVDDEEMICATLRRVLSHAHAVEATTDARDALTRFERGERYDVILCDLMMPAMSGVDLYDALVGIAPDQAERIIFLTGGAFTARAQEFMRRVNNAFVEKPFDVDKLLAAIAARLQQA